MTEQCTGPCPDGCHDVIDTERALWVPLDLRFDSDTELVVSLSTAEVIMAQRQGWALQVDWDTVLRGWPQDPAAQLADQ